MPWEVRRMTTFAPSLPGRLFTGAAAAGAARPSVSPASSIVLPKRMGK